RPCRASREIDGRGRSAELLNHAGRIDAATAGVVALAPGPHLVDRSNRLCLCGSIDSRVQAQGHDWFHCFIPSFTASGRLPSDRAPVLGLRARFPPAPPLVARVMSLLASRNHRTELATAAQSSQSPALRSVVENAS